MFEYTLCRKIHPTTGSSVPASKNDGSIITREAEMRFPLFARRKDGTGYFSIGHVVHDDADVIATVQLSQIGISANYKFACNSDMLAREVAVAMTLGTGFEFILTGEIPFDYTK